MSLQRATRIVTHTARILQSAASYVAEGKGTAHPRDSEYRTQLELYGAEWRGLPADARQAAIDAAQDIHDFTQDHLNAAIAALGA